MIRTGSILLMTLLVLLSQGCTELNEVNAGNASNTSLAENPQPLSINDLPDQRDVKAEIDRRIGPRREWIFENRFGTWLHAPYRWMENPDDPELVKWVEAENENTAQHVAGPLYDALEQELTGILQTTRMPSQRASDLMRRVKRDQFFNLFFRERRPGMAMHPLLEERFPSPKGLYELKLISDSGSDLMRLEIIDLQSGCRLNDVLMIKGSQIFWDDDEQSFLYITHRDNRLGHVTDAVFRHQLGTSQTADTLIYQVEETGVLLRMARLGDRKIIRHDRGYTFDLGWFDDQTGDITPILENSPGPMIPFTLEGIKLYYIRYSDAPLGEIVSYDMSDGTQTLVMAEQTLAIEYAVKSDDVIYVAFVEDAASKLVRYDTVTGAMTPIALPLDGWAFIFDAGGSLGLYMTSYTHDFSIYIYNESLGELILVAEADPPPFELEAFRVYYEAHDGRSVPIWIVKRPDVPLTPQTPVLFYGYGGFSINLLPIYNPQYLPWYARDGVTAYVTLPGGYEYGEAWHQAGMLHNKKNVFEDFAAAAEHLVNEGLASRHHLAANGASNGGLLVGATVNLYPQLFRVAVPEVGVMDMTRFELFTAGKWWVREYGDRDNADEYHNLLSISPYHNLRFGKYPATLVMTAEFDDRVVPSHSYKYAARLKLRQKGPNPVLLHTARWSSHGRYGTTDEAVKAQATRWSFIIKALGME
ncbi:MAG: prolyl oligopeptidase family serine peptidase [Myxococcota bacterium]|nr:prolyl oligopeptidase family serine peptidase [Myxococcota bacterium]